MTNPFTLRTDDALGNYTNIRLADAIVRPGESVPAPPHRIIATDQREGGRLHVLWWEPIDMPDDEYAGAKTIWNGPRHSRSAASHA